MGKDYLLSILMGKSLTDMRESEDLVLVSAFAPLLPSVISLGKSLQISVSLLEKYSHVLHHYRSNKKLLVSQK